MSAVDVELLYFEGCPHSEPLQARLCELLGSRSDAELRLRFVESDDDAQRVRFLGSPSVRVDGRDVEPGADARTDYGLKCRLYRAGTGLVGAPPDAWILDALGAGAYGLERMSDRSVIHRMEGISPAARELHRRILLAFAAGRPLRAGDPLLGLADALAELERRDMIGRDSAGEVVVAYPFSARETPHEVELIDDGTIVHAMCAIDALGIPFMLGRAARITSRDPDTGEAISLIVGPDRPTPTSQAVVRIRAAGTGRSCDCLCPFVEFLARRSETTMGAVLELPDAIELGRRIFGELLAVPSSP